MKLLKILLATTITCLVVVAITLVIRQPQRYPVISTQPDFPAPSPLTPLQPSSTSARYQAITSLDQVFSSTPLPAADESVVTIRATGDVLLARSINYKMRQLNDFTWPFVHVQEFLKSADLTYINLETPLVSDCPSKIDGMIFCGDLRGVESLAFAGIDVVNIANNHASNYGPDGVTETAQVLRQNGFQISGLADDNLSLVTVKGTRFAFLGYNEVNEQPGVATAIDATIQKEVAAARDQADVVIVQFHWGNEYTYQPSTNQQRLAHLAIDAGADLIIGNHPHWYQPIEFYHDKLITYSHGNMVFDQMWSRETRQGLVGTYTFADSTLVGVQFTPVLIENYGQPRILEGSEATTILDNLKYQSYRVAQE